MAKKSTPPTPVCESSQPVIVGYARVSTTDQSTALQVDALERAGCTNIFKDDGISGATADRPALKRALATLKKGDTFVVYKLDRLARSLADLIKILDGFAAKGVEFKSLNESIDTSTPIGRLIWQIIGAFAEFERQVINERVNAGIARAKDQGIRFGRPAKLTQSQISEALRLRASGETYPYIARLFNVGRTTLIETLRREGFAPKGS
jgi:DNA invertase Pin-like site-specific DNA recombinase